MKAIAAMRNQFGGHAVRTPAKGGDAAGESGTPDQAGGAKQAGAGTDHEAGES